VILALAAPHQPTGKFTNASRHAGFRRHNDHAHDTARRSDASQAFTIAPCSPRHFRVRHSQYRSFRLVFATERAHICFLASTAWRRYACHINFLCTPHRRRHVKSSTPDSLAITRVLRMPERANTPASLIRRSSSCVSSRLPPPMATASFTIASIYCRATGPITAHDTVII